MTALTIHLNTDSEVFSVVKTNENSASSRSYHPISEFEALLGLQLQAPSISTGLMPSSLILTDESDAYKTFIFYYPEIKYTLSANTGIDNSVLEANKDIFLREYYDHDDEDDDDDSGYSFLKVPNIVARNVCFVIRQDKQNGSLDYTVGVLTNMVGTRTTANTQLVCPFGNNFGQSICWHNEFDTERLQSKDPFQLETIPYAYLNSIFNNDLSIDGGIDYPREFRDSPWYRISSSEIVRHPLYIHWCAITNGTAAYDSLSHDEVRSFAKGYNFDSLQKGSFVHIRG